MFVYNKKLQFPVKIDKTDPKLASIIISQYGGPDGELGASLRYLSQRFSMPYPELQGLLTDIGTYDTKRNNGSLMAAEQIYNIIERNHVSTKQKQTKQKSAF